MAKWCQTRLALSAVIACVMIAQAPISLGGNEIAGKTMLQRFDQGKRPPKNSIFAGSWRIIKPAGQFNHKVPELIYQFNPDGTMAVMTPKGKPVKGKWVQEAVVKGQPPTAIYRIDNRAQSMWIKGDTLFMDGGDAWIELKRLPNTAMAPGSDALRDPAPLLRACS